ncbi:MULTISPECIES: ribosome alternative rescue factor ArfA [Bacillaceae]|uniref:ribosome alternative rescue factor ArfA n=1 Tax=Bacillaceae TaxID=186817 RepID=UPI000B2E12ED|nr:ribosome alternative rescue factor ArfA [Bacillus sp. FJAT-27916]
MMKKKKKTIGEMTNSRMTWSINPTTRVVKNKKGKGSYSRTKFKHRGDGELFSCIKIAQRSSKMTAGPITV